MQESQTIAPQPVLTCPNCNCEIRLTDSLAAPLIAETRQQFQEQLARKDAEIADKLEALRRDEAKLALATDALEDRVRDCVAAERARVVAEEGRKARDAAASDLLSREREAVELREALRINNEKLAEAQTQQADLLRKERALGDERRELELTVERKVDAAVRQIRARAKLEADEAARQRVAEKDRTIGSMRRTIEELKRKAEQGSQQLQGEVLELEIEEALRGRFPADLIEPVGKGESGADLAQHVNGAMGSTAGVILWETKQTKVWSDSWLPKLRADQRRCGADAALIVSQALPKNVEMFDLIDGVWVAHPRCAIPVAIALRQALIGVNASRLAQQGQQSKMEQVYEYLTGTRFRQRVDAVVEKFSDMREDLDRERKFIIRQWSKREAQIVTVLDSTAGMVGDLQAIAGRAMPSIASLDAPLPEESEPG